jgi:hypothetical protein
VVGPGTVVLDGADVSARRYSATLSGQHPALRRHRRRVLRAAGVAIENRLVRKQRGGIQVAVERGGLRPRGQRPGRHGGRIR